MAKINSTIFKQETIQSWFSGVGTSVNNEVVQPFQNAEQVIWKYNQAIQHNSLTQQGWERLLAQSDDSLKAYLTSIKGSTASMTGYNVALQGNITGFKKVSSAITQYNALSASGAVEQNTFATAISTTNSRLGTYLTGLNGANASLGGYIISLVGATIKTVALKVATIALNSAVTMGASLIISGIVSAISEWINKTENMIEASEEAVEKIKSINEELKNNQKTISDTAKRYAELAQGVDQLTGKNISLSSEDYEEFLSLSNQLAEMFPTLTRNYNDNGDAIVQLSGDVDTIVGSLQNLIEAQRDLTNRQIVDELPTVFDGVAAKSDAYEQELSTLESKRDALVKSLGDVQSEEFSTNFMDGFANKWIEISGDNLEVISQMRDDYIKILEDANIDYEELTPTYEMKDGVEVPVGFTIKINSSDEDVEKAKNTIDGKIQELASQYEADINKLNEEIKTTNEKNKANWTSLSSSIFAWLSTDDSFKVMDDTMQATVQNIVNSLDWGSLDFSSWEDAKQYIQDNILSLFNTADGKEVLADIEVMFGIQTQFNNGDITVEQYQQKLQGFLNSIESLPPETKKSILLLFGIQTNEDGTTTSSVDTMIANVEEKFEGADVNKLTLKDLEIAYSISSEEADKAIAEEKSKIKSELESLSKEGNVDLTIRPVIDSSAMQAAGWDVEDGSIATTFTQGEFIWQGDEENGQYVYVHYTPILPDGTVLTPDELTDYLYGTLEGSQSVLDADNKGIVLKVDTDLNIPEGDIKKFTNGEGSTDAIDGLIQKTGEWDDKVHGVQEQYYDTGEGIGYASNALDGLIEKHKQLENPNEITDLFINTLNSTDYAEIKDELLELAKSGELTPETLSSTEEYANLLKSTDTSAESAMNQILDLLTAQEKLAGFSQGLDKLKSAYEEFKDEDIGFVTAETLQSLPDSFKKLPEFDLFSQIVGDPTSGAEAIQQAFNDIVKAYMLSQDVLQGLVNASEHDIQSYIANFKQLGVTNAEEVVNLAVEALNSENELLNSAEAEYIDYLNNKDDYDTDYLESVASKNGQLASALGEAYKADYDNWCELLHDKAEAYNQFIKALEESGIVYDSSKSIQENAQNAIKKEGYSPSEIDRINRAASNAELSSYLADKQKQALKLDLSQITTDFGTKYSPSTSSGSKDGSKDTINTETYDHIERKLEVIAKKTEKVGEAFEKAFSLNATNIRYKEYLSQIDEEISANNTAIQTYQAKLNSIGLSADWIAKIQNGEYSITDVTDDALNERIGLYQEYYDKLESCQETVEELEKKRLEAQNQYAEKIVEIYDREIEKIDKLIDRRESLIELKEKFGGSASASDLKYEQKKYSQQITIYDKQIDKLKELQKTVAVGSDAWKTYKEQIEANKESVLDITNSIADLAEQLASLPLEKYEKFLEKNDAKNEYYTSKYNNVVSTASKGKLLTNQIDALTAKNDKTQSYATTAKKNFNNSKTSVDKAYNSDMNNKNTTDEEKSVLTEYRNKVKNYTKNNKKIPASLITKIGKDGFGEFHKACINYNEMLEAKDAAVETAKLTAEQTRTEIRELAEQKYNLPIEKYDEGVEKNDKKNALYEAQLSNKTSASSKNKVINKQIELEENNLAKAQNAVKETSKNVTSSISDIKTAKTQESKGKTKTEKSKINKLYTQVSKYTKSKKAIPNDLITKIGKAGLTSLQTACDEYNAALAANKTATDTAKVVAEQTKSNVNELKKQQFDNIQEKYSRKASQIQAKANNIDSRIALLEAKGYQSSASWYNELIAYEKQNLANSQAELKALKAKQNEMTKYTDEWWEAEDAINSVTQAVNDSTLALQEFLNTQREINFENFEFLQGQISRLSEEAQYFIDLMQNKEMTGDNGLTNYGLTAMGLYYQQIETGLNQAQDYAKKIAEIDQELLKEPYDTELLTQKQEYIDAQRDIMTNNESLKKSIADLVKDGYDSLLDSLGEVIDKYKEVLQNAKDAHDYQKNISDKTENINTLQKQITAYASMTGNDEVASKLQSLQAEYKDAQEDLQETLYDKYISDTEEILDEMLDELETFIEELNIEELYKIGVEQITNGVEDIDTTLRTLANNANTPMSNEMTIVWEDNSLMTNLTTAIEEATKAIKATIDEQSDASAFEVFSSKYDKTDYDSQIATAKRDWDSARLRISEYGGITDEEPYLDIKNSLEKDNADMRAEIKLLESKIAKTKNKAKIAEFNQRINDLISKIASNNAEIKTNDLELEKVRELNDGLENATIAYINAVNAKTSAMDNNKAVIKELLSAIANDYPTGLSDEQTELDKKVSDILGMTSYLSKANISQLAELFGVRDNEFFVLQALKNAGFATGGIVKAVGEDGIGLVRNGEGFVMPEVVPIMQDILGAMPKIDTFIDTTLSNLPSNRGNIEQTIEFGDIYMSGVNDPQEFSKQLISTFQNEAKVQKMFGTFVNNSLTGKNSLSIRKY